MAQEISGKQEGLLSESLALDESPEKLEQRLSELADKRGGLKSVLFLVDLKGGTPWNVVLRLGKAQNVNCVSGLNMPMLLEAVLRRSEMSPAELAIAVAEAGKTGVVNSDVILRGIRR